MNNGLPDMMVMYIGGMPQGHAEVYAGYALTTARKLAPKMSGWSSNRLYAVAGPGYFGLGWLDDRIWFQEAGTRPFTMNSLQGKTIPMWIDDPTGTERKKHPKAKVRVTKSGKTQVLIFRKAARKGTRKNVRRRVGGTMVTISVPRSYPGAPGRIANREAASPMTTPGRVGGRIALGNIGVRWRHPGIAPRGFVQESLRRAAVAHGVRPAEPVLLRKAA